MLLSTSPRPVVAMVAALLLAACAGCGRSPESGRESQLNVDLDGTVALEEVRNFLELGPRVAGTPGAKAAADYIAERLVLLGVDATVDSFSDTVPGGTQTFHNVIGSVPGTGDGIVILGSHFDTKAGIGSDFVGANDSGSSTGLLLALASSMANGPQPRDTILFAFFDGEECLKSYCSIDGLHGSRHLADTLTRDGRADRVRAVIILDMIGDRDLTVTLPLNCTPRLKKMALDAARAEDARGSFALSRVPILDDHVPFLEAGMPALDIIDFHFGSRRGENDYWHTAEDTFDKLSADSLQIIGRVVQRMLNAL